MKEISVWGCDHCSMTSRRKGSVARHEARYCRKNLERVRCGSCKHMIHDKGDTEFNIGEPMSVEPAYWYCEAKDIDLDGNTMNENIECELHERS